jgi:biotin transport system substrate-specific component
VLTYLSLGTAGLPIFADFSSGYHTLLGPTGGYLIGFLILPLYSGKLMFESWS